MDKKVAKQIAKLWNENFARSTDATKTEAVAEGEYVYIYNVGELNDGDTFYHIEEMTDVMRAFKVNGIISQDYDTHKVYGRLF